MEGCGGLSLPLPLLHVVQGFCGTGDRYCAPGKCVSGACAGTKPPQTLPKPDQTSKRRPAVGLHVASRGRRRETLHVTLFAPSAQG